MRRALSIFLALFFSLGPLAATLEAGDDARLPACCRRHGAHHCAMSMDAAFRMAEATSGTSIFTTPSTCPAFPVSAAASTPGQQALAPASANLPALLAHSHSLAAARAAALLSQVRTRSGRAPPASTQA